MKIYLENKIYSLFKCVLLLISFTIIENSLRLSTIFPKAASRSVDTYRYNANKLDPKSMCSYCLCRESHQVKQTNVVTCRMRCHHVSFQFGGFAAIKCIIIQRHLSINQF